MMAYIIRCLVVPIIFGAIIGAVVLMRPDLLHERAVQAGYELWYVVAITIGLAISGGSIYVKSRLLKNFLGSMVVGFSLGSLFGNILFFFGAVVIVVFILAVSAKMFPFTFQKGQPGDKPKPE